MSACLDQIVEINEEQVKALKQVARQNPDPSIEASCVAFSRQVTVVYAAVLNTYTIAASLSRRAGSNLQKIEDVWKTMSGFCRVALKTVSTLKDKYPNCGTPGLHDLLLEYMAACDKRLRNVKREIACQKTHLPKGLFPALS
jgi:hypothetical protein